MGLRLDGQAGGALLGRQPGGRAPAPACAQRACACTQRRRSGRLLPHALPVATGTLPPSWGTGWPSLAMLHVGANSLRGTLPPEWGATGTWRAAGGLVLSSNMLSGTLPPSWGTAGAWPVLATLQLDTNALRGTVPAEWGAATAFPALQQL